MDEAARHGLGRETAHRLSQEGHTVCIGARSVDRAETAESELGARFAQLDVTDDASVKTALQVSGEREGRLDARVNNAGTALAGVNGPDAP